MIVLEKTVKSILTKSNLPGCDYCINPYTGCAHKCAYCYAKFMAKYSNHSELWGDFVDVKINAREVLHRELNRKHRPVGEVFIGSVTDAYQPIESRFQITRGLLDELSSSDLTVSILTKSDLVLRDLDIIKNRIDWSVGFSITGLDEDLIRNLEPRTSSIERRIKALQVCKENGVNTYVFVGPIIPGVCDFKEVLKRIALHTKTVYGEMLNRRGDSVEQVRNVLKRLDSKLSQHFLKCVVSEEYWDRVEQEFQDTCAACGITNCTFIRH